MNGFTLLNSLITLGLISLLAMLGATSLTQILSKHQANTFTDQLVRDLEFARNQAVLSQRATTVCPTKNGLDCGYSEDWQEGYMIVIKEDRIYRPFKHQAILENPREYIAFSHNGFSENTNSTFTYTSHDHQRKIIINRQGRIRVE